MKMHFTYAGTITAMHGGIYTEVSGTRYYDFHGETDRASFDHVSGDPAKHLRHASIANMLPIGAL